MAATLRAVATAGNAATGTASSLSITIPSTAVVGDVAVMSISTNNNTSAPTNPTGWTQLNRTTVSGIYTLLYKVLVAGDPGSTITIPFAASNKPVASLRVWAGVDASKITFNTTSTGTTGVTTYPSTALTGVPAGAVVEYDILTRPATTTTGTATLPSGYTDSGASSATSATTSPNNLVKTGYKITSAAGSYGGESSTGSSATGVVYIVSLPAASAAPAAIGGITRAQVVTKLATYSSTPSATSFTSGTITPATAGNALVFALGWDKNPGSVNTPTGWTKLLEVLGASTGLTVFGKVAAGGETSATVTTTVAANGVMTLAEYSGTDATSPFGPAAPTTYSDTGTTSISIDPPAATSAGMALAFVTVDTTQAGWSPTASGWLQAALASDNNGGGNAGLAHLEYQTALAAGTNLAASAFTVTTAADQMAGGALLLQATGAALPLAFSGSIALDGSGVLSTVPTRVTTSGSLSLSGSGVLSTVPASVASSGSLGLSGSGVLSTVPTRVTTSGSLGLSGSGVLSTVPTRVATSGSLSLSGSGAQSLPAGKLAVNGALTLNGSGTATWTGKPGWASSMPLSGSGGLALTMPGLNDDFATLDLSKWAAGSGISVVNGQLHATQTQNWDSALVSKQSYDLTEKMVSVELVNAPSGPGYTDTFFGLSNQSQTVGPTSGYGFDVENGLLGATVNNVENYSYLTQVPYSATAHRFLKMRHNAGRIYWETSPDRIAWTVLASTAANTVSLPITAAYLQLGGGGESALDSVFDNIKTEAVVPVVASGSLSLSGSGTDVLAAQRVTVGTALSLGGSSALGITPTRIVVPKTGSIAVTLAGSGAVGTPAGKPGFADSLALSSGAVQLARTTLRVASSGELDFSGVGSLVLHNDNAFPVYVFTDQGVWRPVKYLRVWNGRAWLPIPAEHFHTN